MPWVDQAKDQSDFAEGQIKYGRAICVWLTRCFPEIGAHPAAIACVIRLHYRDGRGNLRRSVHGDEIRAAVALFDVNFGPEPIERETV